MTREFPSSLQRTRTLPFKCDLLRVMLRLVCFHTFIACMGYKLGLLPLVKLRACPSMPSTRPYLSNTALTLGGLARPSTLAPRACVMLTDCPAVLMQVRSCTLDTWLPGQVAFMAHTGNAIANKYWEASAGDQAKPAYSNLAGEQGEDEGKESVKREGAWW